MKGMMPTPPTLLPTKVDSGQGPGVVGQRDQSHDRVVRRGVTDQEFTDFVKSTYRVLLTRGLRGCYVYFMDAPTRDFLHDPYGTICVVCVVGG